MISSRQGMKRLRSKHRAQSSQYFENLQPKLQTSTFKESEENCLALFSFGHSNHCKVTRSILALSLEY